MSIHCNLPALGIHYITFYFRFCFVWGTGFTVLGTETRAGTCQPRIYH